MTTEEKVDKILEIVSRVEPMVKDHHNTLYGNGQPGLSKDVVLLRQKQADCPARKAATTESKRLNIATLALMIAVISCITSAVLGIITFIKG